MKLPTLPKLQPRERLLATCSGLVLVLVVLDKLVLSPWLAHAKAVNEEILQMEQALNTHERLLQRKDSVLASYARYQRYLGPDIPTDLQMASLLNEIERLAEESNVKVTEIKPAAIEKDDLGTRYMLDVQFSCTLSEWAAFVYRIEASPSLFEVGRAGLTRAQDQGMNVSGSLRLVSATPPVPVSAASPKPPGNED